MFAILLAFGNLDYATVFSLAPYMNEKVVTIVGICLLIGAMAKSSQIGLHVWLPMAIPLKVANGLLIFAYKYYILFYLDVNSFNKQYFDRRINSSIKTLHTYKKDVTTISEVLCRQYSTFTDIHLKKMNREDFIEWFRGFTDAEGCFYIGRNNSKYFSFYFQIKLHIDDQNVLNYIQNTLELGKVYTSKNEATLVIVNKEDIKKIINIFDKNPLNSTKHLNFLSFKEAFEIYLKKDLCNNESSLVFNKRIEYLKNSMNSKRNDFKFYEFHNIRITNYWLLGFVEGDGSFNLVRNSEYKLRFDISQSSKDLMLMTEIKNYLKKLALKSHDSEILEENLYLQKPSKNSSFGMVNITIKNQIHIAKVIIPFFDSMIWLSKKELDYKDWKQVLNLKDLGLHHTKEGLKILDQIFNQMNNRLSSNNNVTYSLLLQKEIDKLLTGPSNYEIIKGKVWIKSLNKYKSSSIKIKLAIIDEKGLILNSFDSVSSCSDFLGISRKTIMKKMAENKAMEFNNILIYIKKIESND